jgi:hypothetical protein
MNVAPVPDTVLEAYLHLLAALPADSKLALIARLSAEVRDELSARPVPERFVQAFGGWESTETAEQLIDRVRDSRLSTRQLESF